MYCSMLECVRVCVCPRFVQVVSMSMWDMCSSDMIYML
jgi:hypothetical protein